MQITILIVSLTGITLVAAAFLFAISHSSTADDNYPATVQVAYRIRRWWMVALCLLGIAVSMASLSPFPLTAIAGSNATVVNAVGGQWYWKLDVSTARVGETVQFRVSSADVNHGFAIYDPADRIIAQTQAMPGYINELNVAFTEPGTYRIMCLEYCGLAHHAMIANFIVSEKQ